MNAIEVKNLTVVFDSQKILDNISFQIDEGSFTAVIGPNGSGKTTLFKAVLGLIPFSGEIKIFSQSIKSEKVKKLIGYVAQHFTFDQTFPVTVAEFLYLNLAKENRKSAQRNIKHALEELDIDKFSNKKIGEISGGQLQRVLVARAILNTPRILLLDEAAAGIDIVGQKEFYHIIKHLNEDRKTTILTVSHEVNFVHSYSQRILCLNKKLFCDGLVKEVLNEKNLIKLYGEHSLHRFHHHEEDSLPHFLHHEEDSLPHFHHHG